MNLSGKQTTQGVVARHKGGRVRLYDEHTRRLSDWKRVADFPELDALRDTQTRTDGQQERQGSFFTAGEAVADLEADLKHQRGIVKETREYNHNAEQDQLHQFLETIKPMKNAPDDADMFNESKPQRINRYMILRKPELQTLVSIFGAYYTTKTTKDQLATILDREVYSRRPL